MTQALTAPLIDEAQIELLRDALGDDDLRDMLSELPESARQALDRIRQAVDADDLDEARRAAHVLKGVASSFGAARVAAMAKEIELDAPSIAAIGQGLAVVDASIDETMAAFVRLTEPAIGEAAP